jgi:hypothetical protein
MCTCVDGTICKIRSLNDEIVSKIERKDSIYLTIYQLYVTNLIASHEKFFIQKSKVLTGK